MMKKLLAISIFITIAGILNAQMMVLGNMSKITASESTLLTGLTNYWQLDEASGTLADEVGSATLTGTDITYSQSGKVGTSISFNGTSSKAATSSGFLKPTTAFSISFWIKTTCSETNQKWFYEYYSGVGGLIGYYNNGLIQLRLSDAVNSVTFSLTGSYNDNAWHHIVFSWSKAGSIIGYVNNVSKLSDAWAYDIIASSAPDMTFMADNYGSGWVSGYLDEVGIWNKALTTDEIAELYNSGNGITYPF